MPSRKSHLVSQHLERISAGAFLQYKDLISDFIRGRHGVYALYKRDRLYYVGLASNLRNRLRHHLRDKHRGLWDRFSVYLTVEGHHIKELESLVVRIIKPKGNSLTGRLPRSQDLKKELAREVRRRQREELDVLMGKRHKIQRKKRAARKKNRNGATLAPYIRSRLKLRRTYKGEKYVATVRPDGRVRYAGKIYDSPSAVARRITGRPCNGWQFWRYERGPGDWVPLAKLRR